MYKTYLWEEVANYLRKDGNEIFWIVQNKIFKPNNFDSIFISYPKKSDLNINSKKNNFENIASADRNINHFKGNSNHYDYYYAKLEFHIKNISPDIVFGECTLFHELMTIDICKKNNILFLYPSEIGYPRNRIIFYQYDTKNPYGGSRIDTNRYDALDFVNQVNNKSLQPNYMKKIQKSFYLIIKDKIIRIIGRFLGEKYNTPKISTKIALDRNLKKYIKIWNKNSIQVSQIRSQNKKLILYPMHMQPESNVDVWGNKYRNQTQLINEISNNLPDEWLLVIKLNPKTKYELDEKLINLVQNNSNIIALHQKSSMNEIFDICNVVITVTGTVAIEALCSGKPLISLIETELLKMKGNNCIDNLKELKKILLSYEKMDLANTNDKINLFDRLMKRTYPGNIVSGPFINPTKVNINSMVSAFNNVLKSK